MTQANTTTPLPESNSSPAGIRPLPSKAPTWPPSTRDRLKIYCTMAGTLQRSFISKKGKPYINLEGMGGTYMCELVDHDKGLVLNPGDYVQVNGYVEFNFDGKPELRAGRITQCSAPSRSSSRPSPAAPTAGDSGAVSE